jgi:hypothetical protein
LWSVSGKTKANVEGRELVIEVQERHRYQKGVREHAAGICERKSQIPFFGRVYKAGVATIHSKEPREHWGV